MTKDIEREAFEALPLAKLALDQDWVRYSEDTNTYYPNEDFCPESAPETMNFAWQSWQAAKAHEAKKLEGCVVVPKDQIEVWWQDSEEPENFATKEDDLSFIAQHIEDDEIMKINEHHTIHLPSKRIYGTWFEKDGERSFVTGSLEECRAMLEAAKENNHE